MSMEIYINCRWAEAEGVYDDGPAYKGEPTDWMVERMMVLRAALQPTDLPGGWQHVIIKDYGELQVTSGGYEFFNFPPVWSEI